MTEQSKSTYNSRSRLSQLVKSTSLWLGSSLLGIIIVTTFLFLNNVTIKSQHGFRFKEQEILKNELTETNQDLRLQLLEASSSDYIDSSRKVRQMVNATEIEYFENYQQTLSQKID